MWTKDKSELMIYELVGKGNQKKSSPILNLDNSNSRFLRFINNQARRVE
jgi:hypothetical protein